MLATITHTQTQTDRKTDTGFMLRISYIGIDRKWKIRNDECLNVDITKIMSCRYNKDLMGKGNQELPLFLLSAWIINIVIYAVERLLDT